MKTLLTWALMLCSAAGFAQSTTAPSTPQTNTDKPKTGLGPKSDIRNPFDSTKKKASNKVGQPQSNLSGWGDTGAAPDKKQGYVGETEKNKRPAKVNELSDGEDPFGKKYRQGNRDDAPERKPKKKKDVGNDNE